MAAAHEPKLALLQITLRVIAAAHGAVPGYLGGGHGTAIDKIAERGHLVRFGRPMFIEARERLRGAQSGQDVRAPASKGLCQWPGRSWDDDSICFRHTAVIEGGRAAIKEILCKHRMKLSARIRSWLGRTKKPLHLQHGELGERVAKRHLKRLGLKFLTANFRPPRGEIDLVFRDRDCLRYVSLNTNIWNG